MFTSSYVVCLIMLLFGHIFADFVFQSDFMAKGKDPNNSGSSIPWRHIMAAHCAVHSFFVLVITGSFVLCLLEFCLHFAIDYSKCKGVFGTGEEAFNIDQCLHYLCKVSWLCILITVKG